MDTHSDEFPAAAQVDLTAVETGPVVTEPAAPLPPAHVMWDIETWGIGNKAVIVSIGAAKFTRDEIVDSFHVGVAPASCQAFGLEMDADTILWWMDPERDEARREWLKLDKIDLPSALIGLDMWIKSGPSVLSIWGNGSTFDNVILRSAFNAVGHDYPVGFWQDACYRTMKNQSAVTVERVGTHHNALDDALSQAKHLQAIWREQDHSAMRAQLERDADQFATYGELHRAKGTSEADEKAAVNEEFVDSIRQLLDGGPVQA